MKAGKARCAALFFLGFASQLFVENITFYVLCAAGILNVLQLVRHKRLSAALVWYFIGAMLGGAQPYPDGDDIHLHRSHEPLRR